MRFLKLAAMTLAISLAATGPSLAEQKKTYNIGAAVYGLKGEFTAARLCPPVFFDPENEKLHA